MQQFSNNKKNWNAKWNKVDSLHSWITFWYRLCYYKCVRNRDLNGLYTQHDNLFYKYREVPFIFVKMTCPIHIYFSVIIENYIIWANKLNKSWFKKIFICRKQVYHLSIHYIKGMNFPLSCINSYINLHIYIYIIYIYIYIIYIYNVMCICIYIWYI